MKRSQETDDNIHVYPLFGREHDTEHGMDCWCEPYRDDKEPREIIHRALH